MTLQEKIIKEFDEKFLAVSYAPINAKPAIKALEEQREGFRKLVEDSFESRINRLEDAVATQANLAVIKKDLLDTLN